MRVSLTARQPGGGSSPIRRPHFKPVSRADSGLSSQAEGAEDLAGEGLSVLAQLHLGTHGSSAELGTCRLRRSIATSAGGEGEITWPLGQPSTLNGRIPIHDSPDLLPTALPQIVEGHFGEAAEFSLPEAFTDPGAPTAHQVRATLGPMSTTSGSSGPGIFPSSFLRTSSNTRGRRNAKLAFRPNVRPTSPSRRLLRHVSAPELPPPQELSLELLSANRAKGLGPPGGFGDFLLSACGRGAKKQRAASAPPAADARDFDGGDPRRSTAIALALQAALRRELSLGRAESPLHLAWRHALRAEEIPQLRRQRLGVGVMLLFAALRAPLPAPCELPLHHFAVIDAGVVQQREMLPRPAVQVPDAIFLMGCAPVFHTLATERSACLPPLAASACYVGVPHALLDERLVHDVLLERPAAGSPRWSAGSLLVLLAMGIMTRKQLVPDRSLKDVWYGQDHGSFFSLVCTLRFLLGLECVRQWHDQCMEHRSEPRGTNVEDFLPFLKDVSSPIRALPAHLDWDALAEGTVDGPRARPLLLAPRVVDMPAEEEEADVTRPADGTHAEKEGVSLKDFASWIGSLQPGRVVFSPKGSKAADLYWRLPDAVLAISFVLTSASAPVTGTDVVHLLRGAVGDPAWWGVPTVSFLVLGSKISVGLEGAVGVGSCVAFGAGQAVDNGGVVPQGCEVIVCSAQCLWSLLGPLKAPLSTHRKLFEAEIADEGRARRSPRKRSEGPRLKGLPAGAGKNAASDWRSRRLAAPKPQQLEANAEVFRHVYEHIYGHTRRLTERVEELCGDTDVGLDSQASSPSATPPPGSAPRPPGSARRVATADRARQSESMAATLPDARRLPALALEAALLAASGAEEPDAGGSPEAEQALGTYATIDSRVPSPVRTEKSRKWRPPTPHPTYKRQHVPESTGETHLFMASMGRGDQEPPPFDFVGFGDWRTAVLQHLKPGSRAGRSTTTLDMKG